jgi:heme O synthase-like polyprenyltransferase
VAAPYTIAALALGLAFFSTGLAAFRGRSDRDRQVLTGARSLHFASIIYLPLLFLSMVLWRA